MAAIVTTEMVDTEKVKDLAQDKFLAGEPNFVGIAFGTGKYHELMRTHSSYNCRAGEGRNRRTILYWWLEGDGLWAPSGDIAGDIGAEGCKEAFLDVANAANAETFDFGDGEKIAR